MKKLVILLLLLINFTAFAELSSEDKSQIDRYIKIWDIHAKNGNNERALEQYAKVLEVDPENRVVLEKIEDLEPKEVDASQFDNLFEWAVEEKSVSEEEITEDKSELGVTNIESLEKGKDYSESKFFTYLSILGLIVIIVLYFLFSDKFFTPKKEEEHDPLSDI